MHFSLVVQSDVGVLGSMGPALLCMGDTLVAMRKKSNKKKRKKEKKERRAIQMIKVTPSDFASHKQVQKTKWLM